MRVAPLVAFASSRCLALLNWLGLLVFTTVLSGCVSVPSGTEDQQVDFAVQGKLMLFRAQKKTALRLLWRQNQGVYQIDVWGSLGQGRVQLRGDAQEMKLLRGGDVIVTGAPQQVMQTQLGWSLPVAAVPYWLFGQPLPQQRVTTDLGAVKKSQVQFSQLGWTVQAQLDLGDGGNAESQLPIPVQLNLSRGDLRARLLVSKFTGSRR